MRRQLVRVVLIATLFASCQGEKFAEGRMMFRDLLALRDLIAKEFQEKVVDVSITKDDRMTVKFINSPLSSGSGEAKQQRADAVAAFVARNYKRTVSSVSIQFVSQDGTTNGGGTFIGRPAPKT